MRWEPDVSRAGWIVERVVERWGDLHVCVPRGFEAYARVLHSVEADRPIGGTWAEVARTGAAWQGGIERRRCTWSEVAAASGTTAHPLMQWAEISSGRLQPLERVGHVDASGWRYSEPDQGNPGAALVAGLARVLREHTATPGAGVAAVWEGWGGLFDRGRRYLTFLTSADDEPDVPPAIVVPEPQLGYEVRHGPRLSLPWRDHVLFDAGVDEFVADDWPERAPWVAMPMMPVAPSLLWPDDQAWVVVSEIDWDSTVVAGTRAAIDAVLAASGIEAFEIDAGADLSSAGDTINR